MVKREKTITSENLKKMLKEMEKRAKKTITLGEWLKETDPETYKKLQKIMGDKKDGNK